MNGINVLTNGPEESGNGDVRTGLTNIANEDKGMGTFRVIRNQPSSIVKNTYEILSIPSTFVTHGSPNFGGQSVNLQFGHLFS
jgi:hypothetical protein